MDFKFKQIFKILLFSIILLIPASSFSIVNISAQLSDALDNDYRYYEDKEYSYDGDENYSYNTDPSKKNNNNNNDLSSHITQTQSNDNINVICDFDMIGDINVEDNSTLIVNCNPVIEIISDENMTDITSTSQLTVIKNFIGCVIDSDGLVLVDCPPGVPSTPEDFTINVDGNNVNPSSSFAGDDTGTILTIDEGEFTVTEEEVSLPAPYQCNTILGQTFDAGADLGNGQYICTTFENDCSGEINARDELTCTIENTIAIDISVDLTTANLGTDEISIFLGNGDGTFATSTEFPVGGTNPGPFSVAVGNFNADTNLDIVTANRDTDEISIFLGNGDGTFATSTEFPVGGTDPLPTSVAVGNFNADTNLDIVTANQDTDEISIFLGNGDGTFATSTEFPVGGTDPLPTSVAVGNFNADTNLDIVTANLVSNEISIFLGNGDGTFATSTEFPVGGTDPTPISVAVGNFNADTNLDIVTANVFSGEISIFLGNGDGTFSTSTEFPVGGTNPIPESVTVGFFNADTNLDIVTANQGSGEISIFLGNGDGTFSPSTQFPVGGIDPFPESVTVGFFNADTDLDIVTVISTSNEISIFLGNGDGTFSPSTEFSVGGTFPGPISVAIGNFN